MIFTFFAYLSQFELLQIPYIAELHLIRQTR